MKDVRIALLLAAGLGTRLRPLTGHRAKPALPFFNRTIIQHLLDRLMSAGIETVCINLHYHGWSVRRCLRKMHHRNLNIVYSYEPSILGTAGAIRPFRDLLGSSSFLLINGDILTDLDFELLIRQHVNRSDILATMVLHPASGYQGYPQIGSDKQNFLSSFPYGPGLSGLTDWSGTFTGIHVINPEILRFIPDASFRCINSRVYAEALESGYRIGTYRHSGYWSDIGTPGRYFDAHLDALKGLYVIDNTTETGSSSLWIHPTASVGRQVTLTSSVVIGNHAIVRDGVSLDRVIVWPGVDVPSGSRFAGGILMDSCTFVPVQVTA